MLKNHWNTLDICLSGQTTKQPLSNFGPENLENIGNFEGCGLTLVAYIKKRIGKWLEKRLELKISSCTERLSESLETTLGEQVTN